MRSVSPTESVGDLRTVETVVRHRIDEDILDRAAALFAQHGFAHTSIKAVADAVGLSKAGLLHHFPTKEALFLAAVEVMREHLRRIRDRLAEQPGGPERDRWALELMADVALDKPGLVSLALIPLTAGEEEHFLGDTGEEDGLVFEIFAAAGADAERVVRVIGALSALAVLSLAANRLGETSAWRGHIVRTCFDALGYRVGSTSEG